MGDRDEAAQEGGPLRRSVSFVDLGADSQGREWRWLSGTAFSDWCHDAERCDLHYVCLELFREYLIAREKRELARQVLARFHRLLGTSGTGVRGGADTAAAALERRIQEHSDSAAALLRARNAELEEKLGIVIEAEIDEQTGRKKASRPFTRQDRLAVQETDGGHMKTTTARGTKTAKPKAKGAKAPKRAASTTTKRKPAAKAKAKAAPAKRAKAKTARATAKAPAKKPLARKAKTGARAAAPSRKATKPAPAKRAAAKRPRATKNLETPAVSAPEERQAA